jgi:hypothetical protein
MVSTEISDRCKELGTACRAEYKRSHGHDPDFDLTDKDRNEIAGYFHLSWRELQWIGALNMERDQCRDIWDEAFFTIDKEVLAPI